MISLPVSGHIQSESCENSNGDPNISPVAAVMMVKYKRSQLFESTSEIAEVRKDKE